MKNKIISKIEKFSRELDSLNRIEISKSAILSNYLFFKEKNSKSEIFPVLKANAYGHGIKEVAKILNSLKPKYICVDSYYEYLNIKDIVKCKTLILGYNKLNNLDQYNFKDIALVVSDLETIKKLSSINKKITIHLKIDTGMNRQGFQLKALKYALEKIKTFPNIILEGVCSHLADADNPIDYSFTQYQIKNLDIAISLIESYKFKLKYKHIANSAGALKFNTSNFNSIRLGIGLYGYNPLDTTDPFNSKIKLKPCMNLYSTVVQIKNVNAGAKIGYNLTFEAQKDMRIGILPIGYYEGIDRRLSNIGYFTNNKEQFRILGRVCMNMSIIDLTDSTLEQYNEVKIINSDSSQINSVQNLSKLCNTIPYVTTTKLSESIRRIIIE